MIEFHRAKLGYVTTKIGSGATPRGGDSVYKSSGISLIRSQNVYDFEFKADGLAHIDDAQAATLANVDIKPGDVLLNITGDSIGRCCMAPESYLPARVNQHVAIIRANAEADPGYLLYYLNAPTNKADLLNRVHGGTRRALTKGILENFEIALPPLPVQRRIAEILGRLDDKIELNRRINRTLEAMAQALYKHWFVDFGPFQDGEFVESAMGLIPKGWEVRRVEDVAQINARIIRNETAPNQISYVDIASVSTGRIDEMMAMTFSEAPSRARRLVSHGDIIWSAVRPNRRAFALIQFPDPNLVVSTGFVVLSPIRVPYSYLYACLSTQDFADFLEARATGAAYPAVRSADFEEASIVIPPNTILERFHSVAQPWFEQQHVLRNEEGQLAATRDYLLPKLLSGEVPPGVVEGRAML